jgi:hypothetical protein
MLLVSDMFLGIPLAASAIGAASAIVSAISFDLGLWQSLGIWWLTADALMLAALVRYALPAPRAAQGGYAGGLLPVAETAGR